MSENVFENMPEIPSEDIEWVKNSLLNYLFFETVKDGVRKYTCSACGKNFKRGRKVMLRTSTPNDYQLSTATPGEVCTCPCCGKRLEVKNIKKCNFDKLYSEKTYLFVLIKNENEVWFRGVNFSKQYKKNDLKPFVNQWECFRYKLTPGLARMWMKYYYFDTEFYENHTFTDAFSWNHGLYTEKYDYSFYYKDDKRLSNTFLKYNGFNNYIQHAFYSNVSEIKYLCWYARHPQIEMLTKIGQTKIIDEMMFNNTDNKKILNWDARTPWDLLRLTHSEYNEYVKRGSDLDLLKTYHRIGGKGVKGFEKATAVNTFFVYPNWRNKINHQAIIKVNSVAKKEGKTAFDTISYFQKISRNSAGSCHHCPGITTKEAFDLWSDYIEMLKAVNPKLKNVPLFPHDLKKRHDELLRTKRRLAAKNKAKEEKEYINSLVEKYKKFNKVTKICKEITDKYSFSDGEYSIIVPQSIEDIIKESVALSMCIHRVENGRYFDRIQRRETYILFLRKNSDIDAPWYVIETEPNGTVQQKRTENDSQYDEDIEAFTPFLREWQKKVQTKLTPSDIELAMRSKQLREENFADLRKTKKTVNYGNHRGELLIDLLEKDLLEVIAG
ncbi:MAG: PcfJ domain-containing protein [Clostridia bacterium]|nr:PcfJ domain-containing protein [Clostridia bacterium]